MTSIGTPRSCAFLRPGAPNLFEITKKKIKTEIIMKQLKISFGKFF